MQLIKLTAIKIQVKLAKESSHLKAEIIKDRKVPNKIHGLDRFLLLKLFPILSIIIFKDYP